MPECSVEMATLAPTQPVPMIPILRGTFRWRGARAQEPGRRVVDRQPEASALAFI